jgi:hypothetical protein
MGLLNDLLHKSHRLKLDLLCNSKSIDKYFIGVRIAIDTVRNSPVFSNFIVKF